MTSGVPWQVEGVGPQARETAREAARRSGMSVGEWLDTPNEAFSGLKPLDLIERGEVDRLWRMIFEVQSGALS